jgi:hypothetical protein
MKPITVLFLLIISFVFSRCEKERGKSYSGQLLLSKKFPIPLGNRKIQMYEMSRPPGWIHPLAAPYTGATSMTNGGGYFQMNFAMAKGLSTISPDTSSNPLVLRSPTEDSTFPSFYREHFTDSVYDPSVPIFIGKTIDTVIFKVGLLTALAPTDTIAFSAKTVTGRLEKEYTGKSGSAGSVIVLDTIANVLFTDYSYAKRRYFNMILGGMKYGTYSGYLTFLPSAASLPHDFPEEDEGKREITIFFKK